ncbi:MAG: MoaD/ThiS family protein [Chloroflexia bacterium]
MVVHILLSGRLKLDGYGRGMPDNGDGTFRLVLPAGGTVLDIVRSISIPPEQVALTMRNGRRCDLGTEVRSGDRIVLVPPDVAALWRALGRMDVAVESVLDF